MGTNRQTNATVRHGNMVFNTDTTSIPKVPLTFVYAIKIPRYDGSQISPNLRWINDAISYEINFNFLLLFCVPIYVITGDSINPIASPMSVIARKIIQTSFALYSSSQAIANGMLTTIIAHFRPNESVINADKIDPNGSQTYTKLPIHDD